MGLFLVHCSPSSPLFYSMLSYVIDVWVKGASVYHENFKMERKSASIFHAATFLTFGATNSHMGRTPFWNWNFVYVIERKLISHEGMWTVGFHTHRKGNLKNLKSSCYPNSSQIWILSLIFSRGCTIWTVNHRCLALCVLDSFTGLLHMCVLMDMIVSVRACYFVLFQ